MAEDHTFPNGNLDLESHGAFVRSLAAHLLGRSGDSKEVAQETMLAAILSKNAHRVPASSMKSWLAAIVSRKVHRQRRIESARRNREQAYGLEVLERRTESGPETDSVRVETVQMVTDAVRALEEPYLKTVLLRFYEGKDPHQIAEIMRVPVATVRSRLQRAKAQLQARLESEFGGSTEGMCIALLPLLPPRSSGLVTTTASTALLGKISMGLKAKTAAAVGLAGLLGWYATGLDGLAADPAPSTTEISADERLTRLDPTTPPPGEAEVHPPELRNREVLAGQPKTESKTKASFKEPNSGLFGRVFYQGKPLEGVEVVQSHVRIHRLSDFRTEEDVMGRIRPIDRTIRGEQRGFSTMTALPADPTLDGPLPADLRTYPIKNDAPVVITDAEGRFAFPQLANKAISLRMSHSQLDLALQSEPILPAGSEVWNAGNFEIPPAVTLSGILAFDHSLTLEGHTASIEGSPDSQAVSNAEGRFEIRGLPPGEQLIRLKLGEGVYRPEWDQSFFVRLGKDTTRKVTLSTRSLPCSLLSIQVTHNGEPFAEETIRFLQRGSEASPTIYLDKNGTGRTTVPRNVALQPTAFHSSNTEGTTIAPDLFVTQREHHTTFQIQSGSLELHVPLSLIPAPETCLVSVQTTIERAQAVRFDQLFGPEGQEILLDAAGRAEVRVPAWMSVQPCFQLKDGPWIHVETLDVMFPAGNSQFQMAEDKLKRGISLSGHDPKLRKVTKKHPKLYRFELMWTNPVTQEADSQGLKINPGTLAACPQSIETLSFTGLPVGDIPIEINLQRKGGNWNTIRTWKRTVDLQPETNATKVQLTE